MHDCDDCQPERFFHRYRIFLTWFTSLIIVSLNQRKLSHDFDKHLFHILGNTNIKPAAMRLYRDVFQASPMLLHQFFAYR